jgi:hypothetical protein
MPEDKPVPSRWTRAVLARAVARRAEATASLPGRFNSDEAAVLASRGATNDHAADDEPPSAQLRMS